MFVYKSFDNPFSVWADHADAISKAYSGTGALKTDFTRTGKRSYKGALGDGVNSVMRYLKNNYLDGPRQVSYFRVVGSFPYALYRSTCRMDLICSLVNGPLDAAHRPSALSGLTHDRF